MERRRRRDSGPPRPPRRAEAARPSAPLGPERVLEVLGGRGRPALSPKALLKRLALPPAALKRLRPILLALQREGLVERQGDRVRLAGGEASGAPRRGAARESRAGAAARSGRRAPRAREFEPEPRPPGWVGIFARRGRGGVVTPYRDDARWAVRVGPEGAAGAQDGDVVAVSPLVSRSRRPEPVGRVTEVLGRPGDPEADFRAIVWRHRLPVEFPAAAEREAEATPDAIPAGELARRADWRGFPFVTIDPSNARDHDDAIAIEPLAGGATRLRVAIADVAHFVPEGSALDAEAFRRGCSVYFPDRAIPMLPHRLSGGVCSLVEGVDRLAIGVALDLSADGVVRAARFAPVVIRSRARLAYDEAAAVMDGGPAPHLSEEVRAQLRGLRAVAEALMRRRFEAGSIDFDLPTAEIVLGDAGHPVDIVEAPRTIAHRAVEEAMLAANRAVASRLDAARIPALYRVHDPPAPPDVAALRALLEGFGLLEPGDPDAITAREVARAVQRAAGRPEERLVNLVALRSMRQARYGDTDRGHFALAFESYTHFTSPIRRYPDLVVHRALKDWLDGGAEAKRRAAARAALVAGVAARSSWRERAAMDAEREMVTLKKCGFMAKRVGEEHAGAISGVAPHGVYVTLDEFFVDGLVHVSKLPGRVELDEAAFALVDRRSRERWRLGDRLRVRVDGVDLVRAWIQLSVVSREGGGGRQAAGGPRASARASTSAARRSHSR